MGIKKIFLILWGMSFFGCAIFDSEENPHLQTLLQEKKWFSVPKRFSPIDLERKTERHPFFDNLPFFDSEEKTVSVLLTNLVGSNRIEEMDLSTGATFFQSRLCFRGWMSKTPGFYMRSWPFSSAIVPLVVSENLRPQRVYVFGHSSPLKEAYTSKEVYRVRLVGAVQEKEVVNGKKETIWLAVDPADFRFKRAKTVDDLWNFIDKRKVKGFIRTYRGKGRDGEKAFKVKRFLTVDDFWKNILKSRRNLSLRRWKKIQRGCFKLYDQLEKHKKTDKHLFQFMNKQGMKLLTCFDTIYPASVNYDSERFWFFTYLKGYFLLYKLGYHFDCAKGGLVRRYQKTDFSLNTENQFCDEKKMVKLFQDLPQFMMSLLHFGHPYYFFREYDSGPEGTHQKIYNFLYQDRYRSYCREEERGEDYEVPWSFNLKEQSILPPDAAWRR